MSGQNYSVISAPRLRMESQNLRVPHPFALFAKGWGFLYLPEQTKKSTLHESVESHPCKERKDGAPIIRSIIRRSVTLLVLEIGSQAFFQVCVVGPGDGPEGTFRGIS